VQNQQLIELTADIVSAHLASNTVAVGDVPNLIQRVHEALSGLGQSAAEAPEAKSPVVSVRASLKPDYLVCMECGKKQTTLKRHLQSAHQMTPAQYRADYGLPQDYPMVAPNYSERRSTLAKSLGLGRKKAEAQPKAAAPDARKAPARAARGRPKKAASKAE
jgi:predicted transcriptional regulator